MSNLKYRCTYSDSDTIVSADVIANDEKDAVFQFYALHSDLDTSIPLDVKPIMVPIDSVIRVHHGFITLSLHPFVADSIGLHNDQRITNEQFHIAITEQNVFLIMGQFKAQNPKEPIPDRSSLFEWFVNEGSPLNTPPEANTTIP